MATNQPDRQQLHNLVEALPPDQLDAARRMLAGLAADPVTLSLLTAPPDDEPYTEEQQRRDAEAIAEFERGEFYTLDQVKRELGL